ncbi:MAG: glycosyltransferase [Deltaproteobacteria bacterium]|nr:glycosyltransferase [Deltaproteobacteria bacterium]MBW2053216.1 glycosyltransferase [Deltaproteobacteria bacterium]MBW2141906.1 glycosyltransferase [Deltaproteobacteria bacterium]MBW2323953.1 glycosyltransferase [Deltaproteobacteria bacterium]
MIAEEINPEGINSAEVIVCIPSYNEAENISFPVLKANEGLTQYFSQKESVIINCDNHSTDGTKEIFLNTQTEVPKIYISTPEGVKGKGNNFKNLFQKAIELKAEAIVVVDADLKSITPLWIKRLGEPLTKDFEYVAPLYVRHKYDGTITNSIAYPLTRSLYGRRVRQPIGGDFGFSGKLAETYASSDKWNEAVSQFGIDIWMTTLAMNKGVPTCQTFMGRPKVHKPKDPSSDLGPMFRQVVGTIFEIMITTSNFWKAVRWSKPTSIFGFGLGEVELPPSVDVNRQKLYEQFTDGFEVNLDIWQEAFSEEVFNKLEEIRSLNQDKFDFPTQMWVKILYHMAIAYKNKAGGDLDVLLESIIPLYYGKTLSFVKKTERMSIQEAEEFIENEAMVFEETKPYLVENWPD